MVKYYFHPCLHTEYCDDSCNTEKDFSTSIEGPFLLSSFPWVPLTPLDEEILSSITNLLVTSKGENLLAVFHFMKTVLFKDYPVDVFLQYSLPLQALIDFCVELSPWRIQESACVTLLTFTELLLSRLLHFDVKHKEEDSSSDRHHDSDDSNEFDVLQIHQLTIPTLCCISLKAVTPLINAAQVHLSNAAVKVAATCINVLCIVLEPKEMWYQIASDSVMKKDLIQIQEVSSSLLQVLNVCSTSLESVYEQLKMCSEEELENILLRKSNLLFFLKKFIGSFSPKSEYSIVFGTAEIQCLRRILCDPAFYYENSTVFIDLLEVMKHLNTEFASQVEILVNSVSSLGSLKDFLQTSSSDYSNFLNYAHMSSTTFFTHCNQIVIEKFIRGFSKQSATSDLSEEEKIKSRVILLQILESPHRDVRFLGYKTLESLLVECIGVLQPLNSVLTQSLRILFILHPDIFYSFIYHGCADVDAQVREKSQSCLLILLRGNLLMAEDIQALALVVWKLCLLDIQCLVSSDLVLQKAIFDLPSILLTAMKDDKSSLELQVLKFYIKCLFSRDPSVRKHGLKNCLASLMISNENEFINPYPLAVDIDDRSCLLISVKDYILFDAVHQFSDKESLKKTVELLKSGQHEGEMLLSVWQQLAFLLHNFNFHRDLEELWPFNNILEAFTCMMKVSEAGIVVSHLPPTLEVIRLCVIYSSSVRDQLKNNTIFLQNLLRALLHFKMDDQVVTEVSLLLFILIYDNVVIRSGSEFSLPQLVTSTQYIPFKHSIYKWHSPMETDPMITTLWEMYSDSKKLQLLIHPQKFLEVIWLFMCSKENEDPLVHPTPDYVSGVSPFHINPSRVFRENISLSMGFINHTLLNIERCTAHKDVKYFISLMEAVLISLNKDFNVNLKIIQNPRWSQALSRFLVCYSDTPMDKKILFHILELLNQYFKVVTRLRNKVSSCIGCALLTVVVKQFTENGSALLDVLKALGKTEWDSGTEASSLHNSQLFESLLALVSILLTLNSNAWECGCQRVPLNKLAMAENIFEILLPVVRLCKTVPQFNLPILVPALQCFAVLSEFVHFNADITMKIIQSMIEFLDAFHVGRGKAHNVYLGRSVSLRCLLCITSVVLNTSRELHQQIFHSIPDFLWLNCALCHCDSNILCSGLKASLAFSSTLCGAQVLQEAFSSISGGIWAMCLRILFDNQNSNSVRIMASLVLINLSSWVVTELKNGKSISLQYLLAGKMIEGKMAFFEILKELDFFNRVRRMIKQIKDNGECGDPLETTKNFDSSDGMKEFISLEESFWTSTIDDIDEGIIFYDRVSLSLIEHLLQLLTNFIFIYEKEVLHHIQHSFIINVLVKELVFMTMKSGYSSNMISLLESSFSLLLIVGDEFCRNTHLAPFIISLISKDVKDDLKALGLLLITSMIEGSGWGSARVLELIHANPFPLIKFIIKILNENSFFEQDHVNRWNASQIMSKSVISSGYLQIVFSFLTSVLLAQNNEGSHLNYYKKTLYSLMESPMALLQGQELSTGCEIARHLLKLMPTELSNFFSNAYNNQADLSDPLNLRNLLEVIKLMFSISDSACCYTFQNPYPLLTILQFSLQQLWDNLMKSNLHIVANLSSEKSLYGDLLFAIHCLEVATNWVYKSKFHEGLLNVCSTLIPLLHPLWIPALKNSALMAAIINFFVPCTTYKEICPLLTRTTSVPGILLSASHTSRPLLSCIVQSAIKALNSAKIKHPPIGGICDNNVYDFCGSLSPLLLKTDLDLIMNTSLIHQCTYIIVKEGFLKYSMNYLKQERNFSSGNSFKLLKILSAATVYEEAVASVLKVPQWTSCLKALLQCDEMRRYVLIVFINMVNSSAAKTFLSTGESSTSFIAILTSPSTGTDDFHLTLTLLWALTNNNERFKALLRKTEVLPFLKDEITLQHHSRVAQIIITILETSSKLQL